MPLQDVLYDAWVSTLARLDNSKTLVEYSIFTRAADQAGQDFASYLDTGSVDPDVLLLSEFGL